ncbi:MAG: hypothetical protein IJ091_06955 [Oscillospiraceae bacterium]|nr:hypothetical protein [Oscillospiraceae bacterium]
MAENKKRKKTGSSKVPTVRFMIYDDSMMEPLIFSSDFRKPETKDEEKALKWCKKTFEDDDGYVHEENLVAFFMETYSTCCTGITAFSSFPDIYGDFMTDVDHEAVDTVINTLSELRVNILSALMEFQRFLGIDSFCFDEDDPQTRDDILATLFDAIDEMKSISDTLDQVFLLGDEIIDTVGEREDPEDNTIQMFPKNQPHFPN